MDNKIEQRKTEIDDIKKSLIELKDNVSLSIEEKRAQADALKAQTEATKKKIEEEIRLLENKTDDESKEQMEKAEALLESCNEIIDLYESIIESIINAGSAESPSTTTQPEDEKKGFFTNIKDWFGDRWENFKKKDSKDKTGILLATAGVGILGFGLFNKKARERRRQRREKRRAARKEKHDTFWGRPLGKILKWTGIGTAAYYVSRGLIFGDWSIFGRNPFSKEKKDGPSTTPGSSIESSEKAYDKLSESDKKVYEDSAMAINEYQQNVMGDENGSQMIEDLMGDSDFDANKAGLIPFMLSNRYASLDKMLSETSFYYEVIGTEGHIAWNKIIDLGLDGLKFLLSPLVGVVNGLTFDLLNLDEGWDKLIEKLKSIGGLEEQLRIVFRKSITVMSYYQSRKGALECQLAENELAKQDPKFSELSEEKKAEKISDCLQNEERYKQHIEPEISNFMKLNLKEATTYLQSKDLLNGELDIQMKAQIGKVEKSRKRLLNIDDDDDTSILDDMKNELNDGRLSDKCQEKLEEFCDDFKEEIFTSGKQTWYAKYLPLFQVLGADSNYLEDIQNTGDYDNIANIYKAQIDGILQKSKDGTLEESDLDLLEETVNDYYKFKKSLISAEINIGKMVDENGNLCVRRVRSFCAGGQNLGSGIQIVFNAKGLDKLEGVGLAAGGILSMDALTFGLLGKLTVGHSPFRSINKRVVFPIAKGGLRLTGRGIERLTGNVLRANIGSILPSCFYTENTLRIGLARGEISLDRAVKVANFNEFRVANVPNAPVISNKVELIKRMFYLSDESEASRLVSVIERFGNNPNVYKNVFKGYYNWTRSSWMKPADWFKLNRSKQLFKIEDSILTKLENIAARVDNMPIGTEKTVMESMMRHIKDFDQAEYFSKMGVGEDMAKLLESGKFIKAEEYGKYLARYAGKIDANDIRAFEKFLIEAKNAGKTGEKCGLFVRNALKNFAKIKERGFLIDKIDDLALNSSKRSKLAEGTKVRLAEMTSRLREMSKNPKFKPFSKNIAKQATAVDELSETVTPEGMKAIKNMKIFGNETAFAKLSLDGMHELSRLSYMLRDVEIGKDLTKALRGAKTLDEVKDILRQQGIVVNHIDDAVLLKIAKSGNGRVISDIVDYGAGFKTINGVQKFLRNPAIKQAGRIAGRGLVILDFVFVGYTFSSEYNEAQLIKQFNLERGEWREKQAYFELATGGVGALTGAAMLIPGLMAIPGVGWALGGILAASIGIMEVGIKYYKDIEKFKQNQADFLSKGIAATKQELTSIDSWDQGLSYTYIDSMSKLKELPSSSPMGHLFGLIGTSSVEKKEAELPRTKEEALESLIRMEELQKNPLAGADLNDPDIIEKPDLVEAIRLSKQQMEEVVKRRMEYFKNKYLNENKPLVDKTQYLANQPLSALDYELQLSSISATMDVDSSYYGDKDPEKYLESKFDELKQGNEGDFEKLEKLFNENPRSLFQMYAELPYYKSMVFQYGDEDYERIMKSCDYFEKYISYKMLGKPISSYPYVDINPDDIDYNQIHNLLSNFTLMPTEFTEEEAENYKGISDNEILERYGISGILGQDILYECAKVLDYNGKNSLDDLKTFFHESKKEVHGIYYDEKKGKRVINEKTWRDDKFATDSELDSLEKIKDMRKYVSSHANSGWSGKMFNENPYVNAEIGNKILKIIDEYIALREGDAAQNGIDNYIKEHGNNGKYVPLPNDLIIKGRKAGLVGVGEHLYKFENGTIVKK